MILSAYDPIDILSTAIPAITSGDPAAALSKIYSTIELRTRVTPNVVVRVADLGKPGGKPHPLVKWLKPTLVLKGQAGTKIVAPHGAAPEKGGAATGLAIAGGILGGVFLLGYVLGR